MNENEMCSKCGVRPCDPFLKKKLCTECAIIEMRSFREKVFNELREE